MKSNEFEYVLLNNIIGYDKVFHGQWMVASTFRCAITRGFRRVLLTPSNSARRYGPKIMRV
jgi:hypothetical protein